MRFLAVLALAVFSLSFTAVASADTTADLSITNPTISGDTTVGSTATYTMQVSNSGPDTADASVADQLGDAEQLVSAAASQGSCTQAAPVTCALGPISPGSSLTLTIQVTYTKAGDNQHTDTVSGAANTDPDHNNDAGGAGFQVSQPDPVVQQTPSAETGSWERTQAHLNVDGLVSPFGSGTYFFEYGKTKGYGSKTAARKVTGGDGVTVKGRLGVLAMGTKYHYRVVLIVGGKTYRGRDKSATTMGKLMWGPLTLKTVKQGSSSAVYTGKLGDGLADAPGACKGTVTISVYTTQGADLLAKKTTMKSDCTYKISVPFGTSQARKYGPKGKVIVQARFSGSRAVSPVGSTGVHP